MAGVTTAMSTSFKVELLEATHCFFATQSAVTVTGANTQFTLTAITTTAGIAVGMAVTGANIAAGAVVASVDSNTQVTLSKANTGTVASATFTADVFNIALFIGTVTGTWNATATNYGTNTGSPTPANIGTDELTTGSGYTAGGMALSNTTPTSSGTGAFTTPAANPSWTSATFTTSGALIYNTTVRQAGVGKRAVGVWSFGGSQSVSSGTFTVLMPVNASGTALLQLN